MKKNNKLLGLMCIFFLSIGILSGCRVQDQGPNRVDQTPTRGGVVTVGTVKEPRSLNPLLVNRIESTGIENAIFSGLLKLDENLNWQPDLAIEVPTVDNGGISADGRVITYQLKQDVRWHDGELFDANDVLFTHRVATNSNVSVVNREGYDRITNIKALDEYTIEITFDRPYAPFHQLFQAVLPEHVLGKEGNINTSDFNRQPIGTGPFMFGEWQQGQLLTLQAYPEYHNDEPYLEQVRFVFVEDQLPLLEMLEEREIDIIQDFSFVLTDEVQEIQGIEIINLASMEWEHLDFNLTNPILKDKAIRQAIAYAIDRQEIIDRVFLGQGEIAHTDIPSQSWAYNPDVKKYSPNLNQAKQLLSEAGWQDTNGDGVLNKGGSSLQLRFSTTEGFTSRQLVQEIIAEQLKQVGIDLVIENYNNNVLLGDVLRNRKFDLILYSFIADTDPFNYSLWHSTQLPPAGQNYVGYVNPDMDAQLEIAVSTADVSVRKEALFKAQEILAEDLPILPLYYRPRLNAARQEIQGFRPNPTAGGLLWNVEEWWIVK